MFADVRQFFITMVRSWSEMVLLLLPSELALMGMIIAHKAVGLYQHMLWWVLLIASLLVPFMQQSSLFIGMSLVCACFVITMLVRSSVSIKTDVYVVAGTRKLFCVAWLVACLIFICLRNYLSVTPLMFLVTFCVLDTYVEFAEQARACVRAVTIFLYHYPFFIMVYLIAWYLLYPLLSWPLIWLAEKGDATPLVANSIALVLWLPWYSSAIMYGYTRFMHEHMDYYYE